MINFVNAKLNIGLHITRRRPDGYHDLETIFYPVGLFNGTPQNPEPFCDVLEVLPRPEGVHDSLSLKGNPIDCPAEKNLVWRALESMREECDTLPPVEIILEKHIPDGAGLGGGSADASFTLRALNHLAGAPVDSVRLKEIALSLGADCPVFIDNVPAYGTGVGEVLKPVDPLLAGYWVTIIKPPIHISTREAFSDIVPCEGRTDLQQAYHSPIGQWQSLMTNDFSLHLYKRYPQLAAIEQQLLSHGALYASMSGSGSAVFGIFSTRQLALLAMKIDAAKDCFTTVCLL